MTPTKSKRDAQTDVAPNVTVGSNEMHMLPASGAISDQNGMSSKSGGQNSGTKPPKDHSLPAKGIRRSSSRTPTNDGREKRQKKAAGGNLT